MTQNARDDIDVICECGRIAFAGPFYALFGHKLKLIAGCGLFRQYMETLFEQGVDILGQVKIRKFPGPFHSRTSSGCRINSKKSGLMRSVIIFSQEKLFIFAMFRERKCQKVIDQNLFVLTLIETSLLRIGGVCPQKENALNTLIVLQPVFNVGARYFRSNLLFSSRYTRRRFLRGSIEKIDSSVNETVDYSSAFSYLMRSCPFYTRCKVFLGKHGFWAETKLLIGSLCMYRCTVRPLNRYLI